MQNELKKIIPTIVISVFLIRFWIEAVTTTILKDSQLINNINNNKIGFHHYQLGLVMLIIAVLIGKFLKTYRGYFNILVGFALALVIDQYTYILSALGIALPFNYRSVEDYLVELILIVLLLMIYSFDGERH